MTGGQKDFVTGPLADLAVQQARDALGEGRLPEALDWLESLSPRDHPRDVEAEVLYRLGKADMSMGMWGRAEERFSQAARTAPSGLLQKRLELVRRLRPLMSDERWATMTAKVDPARRLPQDRFQPVIEVVVRRIPRMGQRPRDAVEQAPVDGEGPQR